MVLTPVQVPVSNLEKSGDMRKVMQAAQEFEAILLESFVNPLEHTFSKLPGDDVELGVNGYQDMAAQALVSGLAKAGGLGIADMIVRNLLGSRGSAQNNSL